MLEESGQRSTDGFKGCVDYAVGQASKEMYS